MSKKINWATMDKRIRDRRAYWSKDDTEAVNASLAKLPDLAGTTDTIELPQPALASSQEADDQADNAEV